MTVIGGERSAAAVQRGMEAGADHWKQRAGNREQESGLEGVTTDGIRQFSVF